MPVAKNFFNVNPAWSPGLAIPDYVEAEGLDNNNVFTTKQAPRGTFDNPKVGNAGYAVPAYVNRDGYGRGASVTYWAPRGTAPRVPDYLSRPTDELVGKSRAPGGGIDYKLDVLSGLMSDGDMSPLEEYGRRSARLLMTRLQRVPEGQKAQALRVVLDAIDPALWGRVSDTAAKMKGIPAARALEDSLAIEMTKGMTSELVQIGKTGKKPKTLSQVGLGCYGCAAAMGAVLEELGSSDNRTTGAGGGGRTGTTPVVTPANTTEWIEVGPFRVPPNGPSGVTEHRVTMSEAWKKSFASDINELSAKLTNYGQMKGKAYAKNFGLDKWLGMKPDATVDPMMVNGAWAIGGGQRIPLYKAKHPKTGEDYGLYITSSPTAFGWTWRPIPPAERSGWGKVWDFIKSIPAKIYGAAKDVVSFAGDVLGGIKGIACEVLSSDVAPAAAAAGAAAAGAPPQAGAAGAQAAKGLCAKKDPVPSDDQPITNAGGGMPWLLIGGAGLAALLLLRKRS